MTADDGLDTMIPSKDSLCNHIGSINLKRRSADASPRAVETADVVGRRSDGCAVNGDVFPSSRSGTIDETEAGECGAPGTIGMDIRVSSHNVSSVSLRTYLCVCLNVFDLIASVSCERRFVIY